MLALMFAMVGACGNEERTSTSARLPVAAPTDRHDTATGVVAGKLFVFGGRRRSNYDEVLTDGAVYDLTTGVWTAISPAPFSPPLEFPAAAVVGQTLAVVGVQCRPHRGARAVSVGGGPFLRVRWRRLAIDRFTA